MDEESQRRNAKIQKLLEMNAKAPVTTDLPLWIGPDDDSDVSDDDVICLDSDTDCDMPPTPTVTKSPHKSAATPTLSSPSKSDTPPRTPSDYDSDETDNQTASYITQCKWCICEQDNMSTKYSKMCDKCNQWYHLDCLGLPKTDLEALIRNRNAEEFVCPVCRDDHVFTNKYRKKIEFRQQKHSTPHVLFSDEQDSQTDNIDSDIENHRPKTTSSVDDFGIAGKQPQQKVMKRLEITDQGKPKPSTPRTTSTAVDPVVSKGPKVVYTAKSSRAPLDKRKNLQCIECQKYLKEKNHPVPKKIRQDFAKENHNLAEVWYDTVYCDDICINAYIDTELSKPEFADVASVDLLDSITKRRQKTVKTATKLTNDLHKRLFEFIATNPRYFIMDSAYKKLIGLKEMAPIKPLSQSSSISITKLGIKKIVSKPPTVVSPPPAKAPSTSSMPVALGQQNHDRSVFVKKICTILTDRHKTASKEVQVSIKDTNIEQLSNAIEVACHEFFGMDTRKYRARMMAILLNLKSASNNSFYLKVLTGKFRPEELPRIGIEELADDRLNKERLMQREEDLKNTKKYSDACNEEKSRPHIKKTSKGEVYVDDVTFTVAPHSVFDGLAEKPAASKPQELSLAAPQITIEPDKPVTLLKQKQQPPLTTTPSIIESPEFVNLLEENLNKTLNALPIETTLPILSLPLSPVKPAETIELQPSSPLLPPQHQQQQQQQLTKKPSMTRHFWQGQIEVHENYIAGMYAEMSVHENPICKSLADKVASVSFPETIELAGQYSLKTFWAYLEHLVHLDARLVFFYLNSKDEQKSSKLYLPGKRDYIPMDDSDMAIIVFDYLISKEKVFEYKVPVALREEIGCIYMAPLKGKSLTECPGLKKKFAISIPRIKDQFIGVMIDCKTIINNKLPKDFNMFHYPKPVDALKRKSTEVIEPTSNVQCKKNSSETSASQQTKRVKLTPPLARNRDPRIKDPAASRDPRLKQKPVELSCESPDPVIDLTCSKTNDTCAHLIEDQISRLKLQFKQRLLTKEEATALVSTLLQSDQLTIEHKTEILNILQAYRIELNKTVEAEDVVVVVPDPVIAVDCEEPVILKEVTKTKRKRSSRFSDALPATASLYSDSIAIVKSNSYPQIKPKIKFNIASNGKSSAFYSLSRLFAKLEVNGYDNELRLEASINLNKILEDNSSPSKSLSDSELDELKKNYGHLFPNLIELMEEKCGRKRSVIVREDENKNEMSQKNFNFELMLS